MTVVTTRPTSSPSSIGAPDVVGAGGRTAATNDDSDSSYVRFHSGDFVQWVFADPTPPSPARVKALSIRARVRRDGGSNVRMETKIDSAGADVAVATRRVTWNSATTIEAIATDVDDDFTFDALAISADALLRVIELYADWTYVEQPVVDTVTSVPAGPTISTSQNPTIAWARTLDPDGGEQRAHHVRVFNAGQYGAGGFDPGTDDAVDDSGIVTDPTARESETAHAIATALPDDDYRAYVRVAQILAGDLYWSEWAYVAFTIDAPAPGIISLTATGISESGWIELGAATDPDADASADFVEIERSVADPSALDSGDDFWVADLEGGDFSEFNGGPGATGGASEVEVVEGGGAYPPAYSGDRMARAFTDGAAAANTYARAVHEMPDPTSSPPGDESLKIGDVVYWGGAFFLPAGFRAAMTNQVDILRADNFPELSPDGISSEGVERFGLSIFNSDGKLRVLTGTIAASGSYDPATLYEPIGPLDLSDLTEDAWHWIEVRSLLGDAQLDAIDASGHGRDGTYAGNFLQGVDSVLTGGLGALGGDDLTSRITTGYSPFAGDTTVFGRYKRTATATKDDLYASDGATWTRVRINSGTGGDVSMTTNAAGGNVTWAGAWPNDGLEHSWRVTFVNATKVAHLWIDGVDKGAKTLATAYSGAVGDIAYGGQLASDTDNEIGVISRVGVILGIMSGADIASIEGQTTAAGWDAATLALSPAQYLKLEERCRAETECWIDEERVGVSSGIPNTQHSPITRMRAGIVATGGASQTNDLTLFFDRIAIASSYIGPDPLAARADWESLRTISATGYVPVEDDDDALAIDAEAPQGVDVTYRARAVHDYGGGLYSYSDWITAVGSWSSGRWWLKHPTRPELDMAISIHSLAEIDRPARQGTQQALGASSVLVTSDTRSPPAGSVTFRIDERAQKLALDALIDDGLPLLLQGVPGQWWDDRWIVLGDEASSRLVDRAYAGGLLEAFGWQEVPRPDRALESEPTSIIPSVFLFPAIDLFPSP